MVNNTASSTLYSHDKTFDYKQVNSKTIIDGGKGVANTETGSWEQSVSVAVNQRSSHGRTWDCEHRTGLDLHELPSPHPILSPKDQDVMGRRAARWLSYLEHKL